MHKFILSWAILATLGFTGQSLWADEITIGAGNGANCVPFGCAGNSLFPVTEYQQVYSSADFSPLPLEIAAVSFFTSGTTGIVTPAKYTISFSTTSVTPGVMSSNPLILDLPQNLGSDNQIFFSGTLGGAVGLELTIGGNVNTPFFYDPSAGNLLMDITISNPGPNGGILFIADDPASSMSRVTNGFVDVSDVGLVTKFSDVPPPPPVVSTTPEPGTMVLFGTGLLAILRRARKKS
jgi:PEP-CTERM motif